MKSCPTCQSVYPSRFSMCPQDGTKLTESSGWSEGTVIRGKYRILSKVGQGGMGAVYKASHMMFDELRALKVINPDLLGDEVFIKRFKKEAIIARKLDHPNAVRVEDIDESEDGLPFIVMEYIEGQSLRDLIEQRGPLPARRTCAIIRQVASALNAAHRLGMVHRDVKPANVVLVDSPRGEQAKVLDFGIAKIKEAHSLDSSSVTLTGTGIVMGTPQYMSPEQALGKRGDQLDGRSDLYSLGVVMYQMLTGELPFKADTTMQLLLAHINTPPRPVLEARPDLEISPALAHVVMKCLEKDPALRPATGAALIEDLAAATSGEPVQGEAKRMRMTPAPPTVIAPPPQDPRALAPEPVMEPHGTAPSDPDRAAETPAGRRMGVKAWVTAAVVTLALLGIVWTVYRFKPRPGSPLQPVAQPPAVARTPSIAMSSAPPPVAEPSTESLPHSAPPAEANLAKPKNKVEHPSSATVKATSRAARLKPSSSAQAARKTHIQATMAAKTQESPPSVSPAAPSPHSNPLLATLVVTTAPGAAIDLDGKPAGVAPANGRLTLHGLTAGTHNLQASLQGFPGIAETVGLPPGGTSFVSAMWGASEATAGPTAARPPRKPRVHGVAASFPVTYLKFLGSSRGLLTIEGNTVKFRSLNGKGSFTSPLTGISWGTSGGRIFYIRLRSGETDRFRSPYAARILAMLQLAARAPSLLGR